MLVKPKLILPRRGIIHAPAFVSRVGDPEWRKIDPAEFQDWLKAQPLAMAGVTAALLGDGYTPGLPITYNASQAIPCPIGPRQVTFTMWGVGGGGAHNTGCSGFASGGSSGYTQFAVALTSAMWGTNIVTLTLGTPGTGKTSTTGNGTAGTNSTLVTGTLTISSVTMGGGGGGTTTPTGGAGGTVTNANAGATNTAGTTGGNNTTTGPGAPNGGGNVTNAPGSTPGGGGSGGGMAQNGQNGGIGQLTAAFA